MMRETLLLAATVLATSTLPAQQSSTPTVRVPGAPRPSQGCPVNFTASRQNPLALSSVTAGTQIRPVAAVRLTFAQPDAEKILKASVTVHGVPPDQLYLPVTELQSPEATEDFLIQRPAGSTLLLRKSLQTARMTNVRFVELTRIDFADGTSWTASDDERCRATPNGFHLLTAKP